MADVRSGGGVVVAVALALSWLASARMLSPSLNTALQPSQLLRDTAQHMTVVLRDVPSST